MNPKYKFTLSTESATRQAFPVYGDDLAIEYSQEKGRQFFRGELSGKLTFLGDDFTFINEKAFDTRFELKIERSLDNGENYSEYWVGQFYKTDCEFDLDTKTIVVEPKVYDRYNNILAGWDKSFNLIDLAPEIEQIRMDKRPMIQVYVSGQSVIGCFLSGMWWEQECTEVDNATQLKNTYHFALNKTRRLCYITQTGSPEIAEMYYGDVPSADTSYDLNNGGAYFFRKLNRIDSQARYFYLQIIRASDKTIMWQYSSTGGSLDPSLDTKYSLFPVSSEASGGVTVQLHDLSIYARYITDLEEAEDGTTSYKLPTTDIVENNRNYKRVVPYYSPDSIIIGSFLTENPTKWGIYQPGTYYFSPSVSPAISGECYPVARAAWNFLSLWYIPFQYDEFIETKWRKPYVLKDAFPLYSVISVLLKAMGSDITHEGTTTYSEFLYGKNPISGINVRHFITPKSNLVNSQYDQPAQKAPTTLKSILEMLEKCFKCYWFVDSDNRLRIEHIAYFMRGGTYTSGTQSVGINLTEMIATRNGKPWSFARNQFSFDKPDMPSRYQFGWMDDVSEMFEGFPIDIVSGYVTEEKVEKIEVGNFTSDVDYILLNANEVSRDGFVLLSPTKSDDEWILPYLSVTTSDDTEHIMQNGYDSFFFLQEYYLYDLPASRYSINGTEYRARGVKKLKTQEGLQFPAPDEIDFVKLVTTSLGNAIISKLSVNLSSRIATATLLYDTE